MDLTEYIWRLLSPMENKTGVHGATEQLLEEIYERGFVDTRRVSKPQWKSAWKKFASGPSSYELQRKDFAGLNPFLYQGAIKRPFDPHRLKDGPRPLSWTSELFQKVLRFETDLTLSAWSRFVEAQILPRFKKADRLLYNAEFKKLLSGILAERASPLRRLELWYHFEREKESEAGKEPVSDSTNKTSTPVPIKDSFVAKPEEAMKRSAIDRLYYHHEQQPMIDDKESLDFLEELAEGNEIEGQESS